MNPLIDRTPLPESSRRQLITLVPVVLAAALALPACAPRRDPQTASSSRLAGRVVSVADGDSFSLLTPDGRRIGIRIGGIDAPEKGQPYDDASRANLIRLLERGSLQIEPIKTDPFGRQVARVQARGEDIALLQLQAGLAWHFVRYLSDQRPEERLQYAQAQRLAREARTGLWSDTQPLEPWTYRQRARP